jgi:hypothetical protein
MSIPEPITQAGLLAGRKSAHILPMPEQKGEYPYSGRNIGELIELFPHHIARCRQTRDLEGVFEICRLTRSAWAEFLKEHNKNGADQFWDPLIEQMEAGRRAMVDVAAGLEAKDRESARQSLANVHRRLHFANVLREKGRDALIDEMFRQLDERLAA